MTFRNPTCPKCDGPFIGAEIKVRFEKYITGRYNHGATTCRVVYMIPRDYKRALRQGRIRRPKVQKVR